MIIKHINIIGAGGHTRSSLNLLKQTFKNTLFKIYDKNYTSPKIEYIDNIKIIELKENIPNKEIIFLSIGNNKEREKLYLQYNKQILDTNLFHTMSYKEDYIKIGKANQIFALAYINSFVEIGDNNIINTSSILEHEVKIGNHNHISVGAKICGRVKIGDRCMIGAGSTVIDKITICDDVIVGAGSIVIKDILEPGVYIGTPAKKIK